MNGTSSGIHGEIIRLKKERNAVILAHNYQPPEIQDIADILGDSLELSRKAADTPAEVIVFCGVLFMAETASILSPDKKVLLPELQAGCPMADMITAQQLRRLKDKNPVSVVLTYVNSSAEVKAESDFCCTSGNALAVVEAVRKTGKQILFVPDKYLGGFIAAKTSTEMVLWEGCCPVHARISPEEVKEKKRAFPDAFVMVHPECRPQVTALADEVVSTGRMISLPRIRHEKRFIVGTETGIMYRLRKEHPEKEFIAVSDNAVCEDMKKITLEKVHSTLESLTPEVRVPEELRRKAIVPLDRMVEIH